MPSSLRGDIGEFGLPDIFQLLTFSRKNGVVNLSREDGARASVWFRDGEIFFASTTANREPLGERLIAAGHITRDVLDRALEIRRLEPASGRRIGRILEDEGHISHAVLETYVQNQIADTIFDVMMWTDGEFAFDSNPEMIEEDIGLTVSVESAVSEGTRRVEEWKLVHTRIPSSAVVLAMCANTVDMGEISLKPAEWQLLAFVNGERSVTELAQLAGRTEYEVARILFGPLSSGLLEVVAEGAPSCIDRSRDVSTSDESARIPAPVAPAPAPVVTSPVAQNASAAAPAVLPASELGEASERDNAESEASDDLVEAVSPTASEATASEPAIVRPTAGSAELVPGAEGTSELGSPLREAPSATSEMPSEAPGRSGAGLFPFDVRVSADDIDEMIRSIDEG